MSPENSDSPLEKSQASVYQLSLPSIRGRNRRHLNLSFAKFSDAAARRVTAGPGGGNTYLRRPGPNGGGAGSQEAQRGAARARPSPPALGKPCDDFNLSLGVQVSIGYMLNFNPWKLAVNLGTFERVRVALFSLLVQGPQCRSRLLRTGDRLHHQVGGNHG